MQEQTRLFFVVESLTANAEIFETLESANGYRDFLRSKNHELIRVYPAIVRNAYRDDTRWNYEDASDTFTHLTEEK